MEVRARGRERRERERERQNFEQGGNFLVAGATRYTVSSGCVLPVKKYVAKYYRPWLVATSIAIETHRGSGRC